MTTVRGATTSDVESIVRLTRSQRQRLAEWSPVYFNPRAGADEAHAGFLGFIVSSDDHETLVLEDDGHLYGFFVRVHQDRHVWVDDLCVDDPGRWPETVRVLVETIPTPWVTCVAAADRRRRDALGAAGLRDVSAYYVRATTDIAPKPTMTSVAIEQQDGQTPSHTFGGRPFSADLPGSLVVVDAQGGYAIGSPSASPPIFDPGGPTCVIDQIIGDNRTTLLDNAVAMAAGRGDAQVVVVCDRADQELAGIAEAAGFTPEVILIGS